MSAINQVIPFIFPFLTWRDRWRLAQVNNKIRSTIFSPMYEKEAFLYIVKVYNSYIEVFEPVTSVWGPPHRGIQYGDLCKPNSELLAIKTWIGALMRIETLYARHLKYPPSLPVAEEVWEVLPDERLDDLVKRVQFLCDDFVTEGFTSFYGTSYLKFVKRYAYPEHQKFSVKNLLALIDNEGYLKLESAATCDVDDPLSGVTPEHTPFSFLEKAVRLVYIPQKGNLTTIQGFTIPCIFKRIALQPFITCAVMRNQELMDTYAFQPGRSPYHLTRWLTRIDNSLSTDPSLQQYGRAIDQLEAHPDLLNLDPAIFWDLQTSDSGTARLNVDELADDWFEKLLDDDEDFESESLFDGGMLSGKYELPFYDAHWKYAMHQIEEHLAKVFPLFDMEEAQQLIDTSTERGTELIQSGDPQLSAGAYLEVSLTDSHAGPNDLRACNNGEGNIRVLYVGPDDAVLYAYKHFCV